MWKQEQFSANRTMFILLALAYFVAIGFWEFDPKSVYKVGHSYMYMLWPEFARHPSAQGFLGTVIITVVWALISGLMGWVTAALLTVIGCLVRKKDR